MSIIPVLLAADALHTTCNENTPLVTVQLPQLAYSLALLLLLLLLLQSCLQCAWSSSCQSCPSFWLLVPGSLGFMGVTELIGTHSSAIFTATLISMMSISVGVQTGLLLWRAAIQLSGSPHRRALHD